MRQTGKGNSDGKNRHEQQGPGYTSGHFWVTSSTVLQLTGFECCRADVFPVTSNVRRTYPIDFPLPVEPWWYLVV